MKLPCDMAASFSAFDLIKQADAICDAIPIRQAEREAASDATLEAWASDYERAAQLYEKAGKTEWAQDSRLEARIIQRMLEARNHDEWGDQPED